MERTGIEVNEPRAPPGHGLACVLFRAVARTRMRDGACIRVYAYRHGTGRSANQRSAPVRAIRATIRSPAGATSTSLQ